jgi:diguanylate cyclase (GGDEF)-like protein/PAS domain S-box-containing protein
MSPAMSMSEIAVIATRLGGFLRRHVLSPLTIVIATATGLLVYLSWFGYQEAVLAAQTNARNLTWMIGSRFGASLDRTRAALDDLAGSLSADLLLPANEAGNQVAVNARLDRDLLYFPELAALHIFDTDGDLLYWSTAGEVRQANIADRPFFRQLRDDARRTIVYSEVIDARTNGQRTMVVCRALRAADGRFLGMIGAQLKLDYFEHLFASLDVGPKGVVAIRRSDDFRLVLRWPALAAEINKDIPAEHAIRRAIVSGARDAVVDVPAFTDGIVRIFSLRTLSDAPFYVLAGVARDDALAQWQTKSLAVGLIGLALLIGLWLLRFLWRRSEGKLAEAIDVARAAEERLRLLANVYEHSGEAILVTNAENRIISVNRAFTRFTGYSLADVQGQNPRMLSAGRSAPADYAAMWRAIREQGGWQGEVWDRRKDGSCYPKLLTISTLKDEGGRVTHYIGNFSDISERKTAEEQIHHLAHHDVLTGLPNRLSLQQRLEQAIVGARRDDRRLAVMFIDLDQFKTINDTLGHPVGDKLLIEVARRLLGCVRESDIVARLGGDEFVVVMTDLVDDNVHGVPVMASKIVRLLSSSFHIDGRKLHSTPSIGISVLPTDGDDVETLMKNADTAMYHAKAQGRNNFQFYTAAMNEAAAERLELENALRQAIERNELILHFQPQVEPIGHQLVGVEALVRWQHPQLGLLAPERFISLAEENGLIEPLGQWVIDRACRQLRQLAQLGYGHLRMAVNVSARQLRQGDFATRVKTLLESHGIASGRLEMEITESLAAESPEATVMLFRDLRALGILLSIDDFGTGHSSLGRLKLLPIQQIKLDRSFVLDIETDANDAAICAATIALAHSLGLAVVGEGVETEAQLKFLRERGCDLIQGYYFSKPLPEADLVEFLRAQPLVGA